MKRSTIAILASILAATGCSKSEEAKGEASAEAAGEASAEASIGEGAVVEEHGEASVALHVAPGGEVKVAVTGKDGKPLRENVEGNVTFAAAAAAPEAKAEGGTKAEGDTKAEAKAEGDAKAEAKAEVKMVPLALDAKTGLLLAAGPKLEGELTRVDYALKASGKPLSGTLFVPAGGTAELVAAAKAGASLDVAGKVGPHGGAILVVSGEPYELVADEASGELRVYLLGPDLKAQVLGEREVRVAFVADAPEVIVLTSADAGLYAKGKLNAKVDPVRVTLGVRHEGKLSVAAFALAPTGRFVVSAAALRVKVRVKGAFDGDVDADLKAKAKVNVHAGAKVDVDAPKVAGKAKVDVKAPDVKVKVKAPDVKVDVKKGASAGASAGAKAGAGVKIGF